MSENLINKFLQSYKRHITPLATIIYFYYSRTYELLGNLKDIRNRLFDLYRTASIKHDEIAQVNLDENKNL